MSYQGFDESPGPGWWQASDGKWYSPETAPARPMATGPEPRRGPSALMIAAVSLLVVGLALAVVGILVGGVDEEARADLQARIDRTDSELSAVQADLEETESTTGVMEEQAETLTADAAEIIDTADGACACAEDLSGAWDALIAAAARFSASSSQATLDALNQVVNEQVNPEEDRLFDIRDELRELMVDRAPLPDGSDA
jgi:uncharacterized protein YoxC